jgi:archaetidylinositol phosphate synthase
MGLGLARRRLKKVASSVARYFTFLNPNYLTMGGLVLSLLVPVVALLTRNPLVPMVVAVVAFLLDSLDGSVARLRGTVSSCGAFLDSLADRVSDASIVLALYLLGCDALLTYVVAILSLVVSYTRARAESLGVSGLSDVGIMTREFRCMYIVAVFAVFYLFGVYVANIALAVLATGLLVTVLQRAVFIAKVLSCKLR